MQLWWCGICRGKPAKECRRSAGKKQRSMCVIFRASGRDSSAVSCMFWFFDSLKSGILWPEGNCYLMIVFSCVPKQGCDSSVFSSTFSQPFLPLFCKIVALYDAFPSNNRWENDLPNREVWEQPRTWTENRAEMWGHYHIRDDLAYKDCLQEHVEPHKTLTTTRKSMKRWTKWAHISKIRQRAFQKRPDQLVLNWSVLRGSLQYWFEDIVPNLQGASPLSLHRGNFFGDQIS